MEYSPPPLFKQGAPARVKVTVFAFISIALLMMDARVHVLATIRQAAGTVLYPFQMAALMPRDALANMGSYFSTLSTLQKEVRELKSQQVASAQALQQAQLQMAENVQLRKLMGAREHLPVKSMMSEILYDARDPSTRKVVLDRGIRQGVAARPAGDRQRRRGRPGHPRVPVHLRSDAADRQGAGDPGAGAAQRLAQRGVRARPIGPARPALHGAERRHPGRRRADHLRHGRRLSGRAGGGQGGAGREQRRRRLRPRGVPAAGRHRPQPPAADPDVAAGPAAASRRGAGQGGRQEAGPAENDAAERAAAGAVGRPAEDPAAACAGRLAGGRRQSGDASGAAARRARRRRRPNKGAGQ